MAFAGSATSGKGVTASTGTSDATDISARRRYYRGGGGAAAAAAFAGIVGTGIAIAAAKNRRDYYYDNGYGYYGGPAYYGRPATNLPAGLGSTGLPFGVQFVGPSGADDRVLALARSYQQATGWRFVPPPGLDVQPG